MSRIEVLEAQPVTTESVKLPAISLVDSLIQEYVSLYASDSDTKEYQAIKKGIERKLAPAQDKIGFLRFKIAERRQELVVENP